MGCTASNQSEQVRFFPVDKAGRRQYHFIALPGRGLLYQANYMCENITFAGTGSSQATIEPVRLSGPP
jgi:hypothetical protein